jgi:Flp pilus assembly protein TadG
MRRLFTPIRRLARHDQGSVALIFGLLLIPLVLAAGVGVDYARAVQFKAQLQAATDDAALAGASAYVSSGAGQTLGIAAATNYMNDAIAALPANNGVSVTVTPGSTSSGSTVTAFQITVTATATFPTTLMAVYKPTLTITTTATANNPIVTGTFSGGGFSADASDQNTAYWYACPANGGVPAASALNFMWQNYNSGSDTGNGSSISIQLAASQHICFALKNVTGGWANYGNNYYGSHPGDVQWFYSNMMPPSADYNIAPGGANTGTHGVYPTNQDCSLVVVQGSMVHGTMTYPTPTQWQCFTTSGRGENTEPSGDTGSGYICNGCGSGPTMATVMTNSAPSCAQLGGNSYQYDWNDMGWSPYDTYNYGTDMQYAFSCSGGSSGSGSGNGTTTTGVTLTN